MDTIKAKIDTRKYRTEIKSASGNILISDEPQEMGGKNLGFSPTELLASSSGFLHFNYITNVH